MVMVMIMVIYYNYYITVTITNNITMTIQILLPSTIITNFVKTGAIVTKSSLSYVTSISLLEYSADTVWICVILSSIFI